MADASIIDIGGVQWNVKDTEARQKVLDLENKMKLIESVTFTGTISFNAKLRYLSEDESHIFYIFWLPTKIIKASTKITAFSIYPPDQNTDIIEHINIAVSQENNANISTGNYSPIGKNYCGRGIYLINYTDNLNFKVSGMGILSRKK